MSRTIQEMVSSYDALDRQIDDHTAKIDAIKKSKVTLAEEIRNAHGAGPHEINGRKVIVVSMKGTTFLRAPLVPPTRKPKAAVAAAVPEDPTDGLPIE